MKSPFKTMAEVRAANKVIGNCWFSTKTMKFWKSRIESELIAGRYFITSEDEFALDGRKPARIYAVRYANDDGSIKTLESHIRSREEARELIEDYKLKVEEVV